MQTDRVGGVIRLAVTAISFLIVHQADPNSAQATVGVVGHRGDSINAPENTIAAIDSAAIFADFTEFDVRLASDGELVLMHDSTVNRTTDGTGTRVGQDADRTENVGRRLVVFPRVRR